MVTSMLTMSPSSRGRLQADSIQSSARNRTNTHSSGIPWAMMLLTLEGIEPAVREVGK